MVVNTTSDRVKHAQNAVVEFLLVNHPLDCPVCDKGGECPLQDISFGWGAGRSRVIEPKRHFKKPLELSPLVAIDRERCILCYRCVRFSQEVAEDHQLVFLERGDHTYVGTHHGHPYVAPFSGNIVSLCPVGALTSTAYRFRARPWDIENAGTVCTLCPAQCNVEFSVRDDAKVLRVLDARHNEERRRRLALRQGPLRLPDRSTRASASRQPMIREGGVAARAPVGARARARRPTLLKKSGARTTLIAGGETTNEEGFLAQKLHARGARVGRPRLAHRAARLPSRRDPRAPGSVGVGAGRRVGGRGAGRRDRAGRRDADPRAARAQGAPPQRREGRGGVVAPVALDGAAAATVRFAPGAGEALLAALAAALGSPGRPARRSTIRSPRARRRGEPEAEPSSPRTATRSEMGERTEPDPGAPAPVTGPCSIRLRGRWPRRRLGGARPGAVINLRGEAPGVARAGGRAGARRGQI